MIRNRLGPPARSLMVAAAVVCWIPCVPAAAADAGTPGPPRKLNADANGPSVIELDWLLPSDSGGAAVTGYWIEGSSTGTGGWTRRVRDPRATSYTDTGLSPGTVPGAPRSLRVSPNGLRGSNELLLIWTPPASTGGSPITGYRIERAATRVGPWRILVPSTGSGACIRCTYTDRSLSPNTTWFYRVRALNAQGQGAPSNVDDATTLAAPPGPPQHVRARGAGPDSILLAWDAPAATGGAPVTGYAIQRIGPNDNSWIIHRSNTGTTATTFTDTGLEPASSIPVPGGGDQPRGTRRLVVRGEHEHIP